MTPSQVFSSSSQGPAAVGSPATTRVPAGKREAASGDRDRTCTSSPRSRRRATTRRPTSPVPPVTSTRIRAPKQFTTENTESTEQTKDSSENQEPDRSLSSDLLSCLLCVL